jgi:hypothetical protein
MHGSDWITRPEARLLPRPALLSPAVVKAAIIVSGEWGRFAFGERWWVDRVAVGLCALDPSLRSFSDAAESSNPASPSCVPFVVYRLGFALPRPGSTDGSWPFVQVFARPILTAGKTSRAILGSIVAQRTYPSPRSGPSSMSRWQIMGQPSLGGGACPCYCPVCKIYDDTIVFLAPFIQRGFLSPFSKGVGSCS